MLNLDYTPTPETYNEVKLDMNRTKKLRELLNENGFSDIVQCIDKQLDEKMVFSGKLVKMKYCNPHQWSKVSYNMLIKHYTPSSFSDDERVELMKSAIINNCHCLLCSLPYKYKDVDIEKILKKFEEESDDSFELALHFNGGYYNFYHELFNDDENYRKDDELEEIERQIDELKAKGDYTQAELDSVQEKMNLYNQKEEDNLISLIDYYSFSPRKTKRRKKEN